MLMTFQTASKVHLVKSFRDCFGLPLREARDMVFDGINLYSKEDFSFIAERIVKFKEDCSDLQMDIRDAIPGKGLYMDAVMGSFNAKNDIKANVTHTTNTVNIPPPDIIQPTRVGEVITLSNIEMGLQNLEASFRTQVSGILSKLEFVNNRLNTLEKHSVEVVNLREEVEILTAGLSATNAEFEGV